MGRKQQETVFCQICKEQKKRSEAIPGELIREPIAETIRKTYPDWSFVAGILAFLFALFGGSGGGGGDGGSVGVTTEGTLSTAGLGAAGVAAAGIGGGGGDSGTTLTASALSGGAVGISVGGNGSAAGNGGTVSVTNSANITTTGVLSEAIRAHSIGRGGGNSGTLVTANGLSLGDIGIGVGGSGGSGGASGNVTVTNPPGLASQGTLSTSGTFATAIDAPSPSPVAGATPRDPSRPRDCPWGP